MVLFGVEEGVLVLLRMMLVLVLVLVLVGDPSGDGDRRGSGPAATTRMVGRVADDTYRIARTKRHVLEPSHRHGIPLGQQPRIPSHIARHRRHLRRRVHRLSTRGRRVGTAKGRAGPIQIRARDVDRLDHPRRPAEARHPTVAAGARDEERGK